MRWLLTIVLAAVMQFSNHSLEQVPAELSIDHFSSMQLEGTGLTVLEVLDDNPAFTRYAIEYFSNGLKISGIMNIPKGDGPFPLVVLNHGYIDPAVYTRGRGLKREQKYLAEHGFAVIHPDYRGHALSDESPDTRMVYDAGLEYAMDSINAIYAVRSANLPSINTSRIGMLGHSLGGGVALNIAVGYPDLIDALILYAPVHADVRENFLRWEDKRDPGDRTREVLGAPEEGGELWAQLSPQTYLDRITAPVLLFQGTEDEDVPLEWSDDLNRRLQDRDGSRTVAATSEDNRSAGSVTRADVEYVLFKGEEHEFIDKFPQFMEKSVEFLTQNLVGL